MRVLIIRLTSIGDILLTTPVPKVLKEANPDTHTTYLVHEGFEEILINNPYCDEIITVRAHLIRNFLQSKKWWEEIHRFFSLIKQLRNKHFDVVLDFHCVGKTAFLGYLSGAPIRICSKKNKFSFLYSHINKTDKESHIVDEQLHTLTYIDSYVNHDNAILSIHTTKDDKDVAAQLLSHEQGRMLIGIAPFTSNPLKDWGVNNFAYVCTWIYTHLNARLFLIGDALRCAESEEIVSKAGVPILNLVGKTSLKELAEVIRVADLFITGDTAPLHIAVAVNTPTISLFLKMMSVRWSPYKGENIMLVAEDNNINSISIDQVIRTIQEMHLK